MRNENWNQIYITIEPCSQKPCLLSPIRTKKKRVLLSISVHTCLFCVSTYMCVASTALVLNWGWLLPPRDVRQRLEIFLVVTAWGGVATGIQWVETRDAGKPPAMHRTAPQQRIIQNIDTTLQWLAQSFHFLSCSDRSTQMKSESPANSPSMPPPLETIL